MRAVVYRRYGPPDVLETVDADDPVPRAGEVKVRVRAASLNPLDAKLRAGHLRLLPTVDRPPRGTGVDFAGGDAGLRSTTHKLLAEIDDCMAGQRFNVMVARVMELVNAARKVVDGGAGPADPAVREAAEVVTIVLSLVAPYIAEEMWEALGHAPSVAEASWPIVDPSLLITESVTCVVQVQGKVRARLEVAPDISEAELRELALSTDGVVRSLAGRDIAKVIIRAPKLVSIVPA